MLIKLSFDFHEDTANTLEKLAKEMGISEEEVIKIAIELYRQKKTTIKDSNETRLK